MTLTQLVAGNIRTEVARQRITQVDIADALGISQPAVSRRLRGEMSLRISELDIFAALLKTTPVSLMESPGVSK